MKKLESLIKTYHDFPIEGIAFKDILGITQNPEVFSELILKMSENQIIKNSEAIISIEARGFIFGSAISLKSSKPMIFARKPGKLPGDLIQENYNLEYGENSLSIQKGAIEKYNSFAIVDDLLATGGTAKCVIDMLKNNNKDVLALSVIVQLSFLKGAESLGIPVYSEVQY